MSSIAEEIAGLKVAASAQTTASQALSQEVAGKMGQIDQKVASAKNAFDVFIATADARYKTQTPAKFNVGGQWDKFYPVRISLRGGPVNKLNIFRPNANENKGGIDGYDPLANPQTFTASILTIGDSWGHRVPFYAFDSYHYQSNKFIGKVVNNYRMSSLWIWLRGGGVTYSICHDSLFIAPEKIASFDTVSSDMSPFVAVYLSGFDHAEYGVEYQPMLATEIDLSLPENRYIRGIS
jgi:hypothetical protein